MLISARARSNGLAFLVGWIASLAIVGVVVLPYRQPIPVLYDLLTGDKAEETLKGWRAWRSANSATVMFILFLVFGAVLLGKGIGGLSG